MNEPSRPKRKTILAIDLQAAEQVDDAVVGGAEVEDVDGEQEEADDRDGDVAEAVDGDVLRELANLRGTIRASRKVSRFRKHQPGTGSSARQRAVQRRERARMAAHEMRQDRHGREDAVAADQRESGAARQLEVLDDRPIAGMLQLRRGADQASAQQELDARLQVRQIRHRDEQLAARRAAREAARRAPAADPRYARCSSTSRQSARSNEPSGNGSAITEPVVTCADE